MQINGIEPPPKTPPTLSQEDFEDSRPSDAWVRSMKLNAQRRRN